MGFPRLTLLAGLCAAAAFAPAEAGTTRDRAQPRSRSPERRLPSRVRFEPNLGQWDARVRFIGRSPTCMVMLADGEAVLRLGGPGGPPPGGIVVENAPRPVSEPGGDLRMAFVGASAAAPVAASGLRTSVSNYFIGNDPARWRSRVPHYDAAAYRGLWPGVDLVFRGDPAELEYDLVLAPGADLAAARFRFSAPCSVDEAGDLLVRMPRGVVRQTAPRIFQETAGGRREVGGAFVVGGDGTVGFETGRYDRALPLVVDPKVSYCSYLGGSQQDIPRGVAVDANGSILVTGQTDSTDFPRQAAYQSTFVGATTGTIVDGFITKYAADGQSLLFSTYYGGDGLEDPRAVAADPSGNVVVVGYAASNNLPAVASFQAANGGGVYDMFIVKFDQGGGFIVFSTYLGTAGEDQARDVACDASGIYVSGFTTNASFPTAQAIQSTYGGGNADAVLLKFKPDGSGLLYSTYYGGTLQDVSLSMAIDSAGAAYLTGGTASTDFPVVNPLQAAFAGGGTGAFPNDDFCVKVAAGGNSVVWATYLGGQSFEDCYQVAVTPNGEACLTGTTGSTNFPVVTGLKSNYSGGALEGWCTKINAGGTGLVFSTYLGGTGDELFYGAGCDSSGNVTVCGVTNSSDIATTNAFQPTYTGGGSPANDAFVVKIASGGFNFLYASYFGGTSFDDATALAMDGNGDVVMVGVTGGPTLSTVNPQQVVYGGGSREGYVVRLVLVPPLVPSLLQASIAGGGAVQLNWTDQANNESSFEIERRTGPGPFGPLATVSADVVAYQDVLVVPSTTYTYRVRAVNPDGASPYTNEAAVTTNATVPPPTAPNNLQVVVVTSTRTDLTWNDRSSNENLFQIERRIIPGSFLPVSSQPADTVAWSDTTIGPDSSVLYRVRAVGPTNFSGWTAEAGGLTPPSVLLSAVKASLTDSSIPAKDKAKAKGVYSFLAASPDAAIDPVAQGVSFYVGSEDNPAVVTVPPGAPGWKVKGNKVTWKTPRDAPSKASISFDLVKLTFKASVSKITFPGPVTNPVRLSIRVGNDAGSLRATWVNNKPGVYSIKQ